MNSFKTVFLCFCHNLLRNFYVTGSARCSLALLISYLKKEYKSYSQDIFYLENWKYVYSLLVTICVFFISYYLELFYKGLIKFNIY